MSDIGRDAIEPADDKGARRRRGQFEVTARLLRDYAAEMYRIADLIGAHLDSESKSWWSGRASQSVVTAVGRYRVLWEHVLDVALSASQMLVHYRPDPGVAAELRIRYKDAEHAVGRAGELVNLALQAANGELGQVNKDERLLAAVGLAQKAVTPH